MYEELASIREIVDLSPGEALDSAQAFLIDQGYRVVQRTDTSLTTNRQKREGVFGHSLLNLVIAAQPQPQGGVQIKVRGNDREGVQAQRTAWKQWADGLPKKRPEAQSNEGAISSESRRSDALRKQMEELQAELEKTLAEEREREQLGDEDVDSSMVRFDTTNENLIETRNSQRGMRSPVPVSPETQDVRKEPREDLGVAEEASNVLKLSSHIARKEAAKEESPDEVVSSKVVEAQSFRLVNGDGDIRAVLTVDEDSPYLGLWDSKGRIRAMMTASETSVDLGLTDSLGRLRSRLAVGSNDSPTLDFVDSDGQLRLRLTMEEGSAPSITFVDENGSPRASFKEDPEGRHLLGFVDGNGKTRGTFHMGRDGTSKLILRDMLGVIRCMLSIDAEGSPNIGLFEGGEEVRAALMLGENGTPTLALSDNTGTPRVFLSIRQDGSPHLSFLDGRGNVTWQAP